MTFAGITNEKQRADVIAYLDTLSKNPRAAADGARSQPAAAAEGAAPQPP